MNKVTSTIRHAYIIISIIIFGTLLFGCSSSSNEDPKGTPLIITGTAATGAALDGSIKIYGLNGGEITGITIDTSGNYSANVTGLQPPYLIVAIPSSTSTQDTQYSIANGAGTTNVTPLTTMTIFIAYGSDPANLISSWPSSAISIQGNLTNAQAKVNANFIDVFSTINPSLDIDFTIYDFFSTSFDIGENIDQILDLLNIEINGSTITIEVNGNGFIFDNEVDTADIDIGGTPNSTESNITGKLTITGTGASLLPTAEFTAGKLIGNEIISALDLGILQIARFDGFSANDKLLQVSYKLSTLNVFNVSYADYESYVQDPENINENIARQWTANTEDPLGTVNMTFNGTSLVFTNSTLVLPDPLDDTLILTGNEIILNGTITLQ